MKTYDQVETNSHDRIRELCARALTAQGAEAEAIIKQLRQALHEHATFVRSMTSHALKRLQTRSQAIKVGGTRSGSRMTRRRIVYVQLVRLTAAVGRVALTSKTPPAIRQ